jgi:hypothetical protein
MIFQLAIGLCFGFYFSKVLQELVRQKLAIQTRRKTCFDCQQHILILKHAVIIMMMFLWLSRSAWISLEKIDNFY